MITLRDILLPGLTGCLGRSGRVLRQVLPSSAVGEWRHACRRGIGTLRTKITEDIPAEAATNYHLVGAVAPPPLGRIQVALHVIHPLVGAWRCVETPKRQRNGEREYWDPPLDPADLPEGMLVIPAELLSQRFDPEPWMRELLGGAWDDLRIVCPRTVGDLVFNWCD